MPFLGGEQSVFEVNAMASHRHPGSAEEASRLETETMALVLEARHGSHAADVAEFFASLHGQKGDAGRSSAWVGVAALVRRRTEARLTES